MRAFIALAVCVACAASASAAGPLKLSGGRRSEDALRRFVENDPALKAKIDDAMRREEAFLAESRESDLRDAVSGAADPGEELRRGLAQAAGEDRRRLLERLPGYSAPREPGCATLESCASPSLAADVKDPRELPDAIRGLVRPWMLLQQARGSAALVRAAPAGDGDALLLVSLKGADAPPLTLNVSPRLLGGFKVWFDQPLALAALYGRERDAVLGRAR